MRSTWSLLLLMVGVAAIEPQDSAHADLDMDAALLQNGFEEEQIDLQRTPLDSSVLLGIEYDDERLDESGHVVEDKTRSLQDSSFSSSWCSSTILDFDTDGVGTNLNNGDYVRNEWRSAYGLRVFANGRGNTGYTPSNMPRLFDSENPGGFRQLGSPNSKCSTKGGPGSGSGGFPGRPGENCEPLGLVLIIQEHDTSYPKDNAQGGVITFVFDRPTDVTSIGLLDINTASSKIYVTRENGSRRLIRIPRLGNNSVQTVPIYQRNARKVQVSFRYNGAVTHLTFCPPTTPAPSPHPTIDSGCALSKNVNVDDFEGSDPLQGWVNGKIDFDPGFTKFLGRFIKNDALPSKEYFVNPQADSVVVEFDFYEIDSWNGSNQYGPDCIYPIIDGEQLDVGIFSAREDEGTRQGVSPNGISWISQSQGPPRHIGFRGGSPSYYDQIHHITVLVPAQFYQNDGLVKLSFRTQVTATRVTDESAGYDNIVITEHYDCGTTARPTPSPACQPTIVESEEDFEDRSLAGWTNGKLDFDPGFTNFLGRFVKGNHDPFKTYHVATDADVAVVEFDFYEIDSWNSDNRYGPDRIFLLIDTEILDIGIFGSNRDEGVKRRTTPNGIVWERRSQGPPRHIGFRNGRTYFRDQIHHITATVPSEFFSTDGQITLTFQTRVTATRATDESSGFDNIIITSKFDCGGVRTPAPTPRTPRPTPRTPRPTPSPTAKPTARPLGSICGFVFVDNDNDDQPDDVLSGVVVELLDSSDIQFDFTQTGQGGEYCFNNLPEGQYTIVQSTVNGFITVTGMEIFVTIGQDNPLDSTGNDFIVEPLRTISGKVFEDTNGDDVGDDGIRFVTVQLIKPDQSVEEDTTNFDGAFLFTGLPPGIYVLREVTPTGFDDVTDSDNGNPNEIIVNVNEDDATGLFFVDRRPATPRPTPRTARPTPRTPRPTPRTPRPTPRTPRPTPRTPRPTPRSSKSKGKGMSSSSSSSSSKSKGKGMSSSSSSSKSKGKGMSSSSSSSSSKSKGRGNPRPTPRTPRPTPRKPRPTPRPTDRPTRRTPRPTPRTPRPTPRSSKSKGMSSSSSSSSSKSKGKGKGMSSSSSSSKSRRRELAEEQTEYSVLAGTSMATSTKWKGCEDGHNSKKIEWLTTSSATCRAPMNGKDDPIAVVYQDGDSVSFTVSMKESFGKVGGCETEEETTTMEWLAIHFVGTKGESECVISEHIELCHHEEEQQQAVDMHTATCDKNGFAVVHIFFKDDSLIQGHTIAEVNHDDDDEEEAVDVPSSCASASAANYSNNKSLLSTTTTCHLQYLIDCKPNPCDIENDKHHQYHQPGHGDDADFPLRLHHRRRALRGWESQQ